MNKRIALPTLLSLVLLLGAGCSPTASKPTDMGGSTQENTIPETNKTSTTDAHEEPTDTMMVHGSYEAYSPEKLERAETGNVVLFFHAGWCPTCKALNDDILAHAADIPDDLTILKVDYDTEAALKKKYGVTYQHTLVQVDRSGTMITKWSGGNTLQSVGTHIE